MNYKFVKFGSSFKYCMNPNNSTKDMWKMALRDPAYLLLIGICLIWVSILVSLTIFIVIK